MCVCFPTINIEAFHCSSEVSMKSRTLPRAIRLFACCYDANHHSVLCTALAYGDNLYEMCDGRVTAEATVGFTSDATSIVRSNLGSFITCCNESFWISSGLHQLIRLEGMGAGIKSSSLLNNFLAVCNDSMVRVVDVEMNKTIWAKEGNFAAVALCPRKHHLAAGTNTHVIIFPCCEGAQTPPLDAKGVAFVATSNCCGLEWVSLQNDCVLAVFQCANTAVDLFSFTSEPGDAFGSTRYQLLHLSRLRFPAGSMPQIVPHNVSDRGSSLPTKLTLMHWEANYLRWCTYKFSQHSVPQRDVGGQIQTDTVLGHSNKKMNACFVMPSFVDRQAVVTPGGSWEKSHSPSVLVYVGFDDTSIVVLAVDYGACTLAVHQIVAGGLHSGLLPVCTASSGIFFAHVQVSGLAAACSLYLWVHENSERITARLLQTRTVTYSGEALVSCNLRGCSTGLDLLVNNKPIASFDVQASLPRLDVELSTLQLGVSVTLSPSLSVLCSTSSMELAIPDKYQSLPTHSRLVMSHHSVRRALVVVSLLVDEELSIIVWNLVTGGLPVVRVFEEVQCATSIDVSHDITFIRRGSVNLYRWSTQAHESVVGIDSPLPKVISLRDGIAVMTSAFVVLVAGSDSGLVPSFLTNFRDAVFSLDWDRLDAILHVLATDLPTCAEAALRLIHERTGQSIWEGVRHVNSRLRLVTAPENCCNWKPGQYQFKPANPEELEKVSSRLIDLQFYGLSSSEQLELLSVIETVRLSQVMLDPLRDLAAARVIMSLQERDVRRQLRLPTFPLTWLVALWATLSDSQDIIAGRVSTSFERKGSGWDDVAASKIAFWATSTALLRKVTERVARQQYQTNREVRDCALMYLLSGKKSTLVALCKAGNDMRLHQFFSRDFEDEKNRSAAVSNAYAAIGKGNINLGAAFFLLAGDTKSAAQIAFDRAEDLQLAMTIIRLSTDDDKLSVQWLYNAVCSKNQPMPTFERALFHFRMAEYVAAVKVIAQCGADQVGNEFELFEAVELLHYSSSRVVLLSRRTSEYFDAPSEVAILSNALRHTLESSRFAFRKESVVTQLKDALNRATQGKPAAQLPPQAQHCQRNSTIRQTVGAADFASGTVQLCADSDDDDGDADADEATTCVSEPSRDLLVPQAGADEQRHLTADQIGAVELMIRSAECVPKNPLVSEHETRRVLSWLIPDPAAIDGNDCNAQVDDRHFSDILQKLADVPIDSTLSRDIVCPALLLLLMRRCLRTEDSALAIATVSCCALWSSDAICAIDHCSLIEELWGSKLQALERATSRLDDDCLPPMSDQDDNRLGDQMMAACLLHMASINVCSMVLKRVTTTLKQVRPSNESIISQPFNLWALEKTAYSATAMVRNAETVLICQACGVARDETLSFVTQCREAKHYLREKQASALTDTPAPMLEHQRSKFLNYLDTYAASTSDRPRIPEVILPPNKISIEQQRWFKQLVAKCKCSALPDELLAMSTQDETVLKWFQYVWSLRNHRFCEARRFLIDRAITTGAALSAPHFFHVESHAISSLVVDHSTCDNVAVGTSSKTSLAHGLREMLAGDNNVYLEQRSAERNAALESFATWQLSPTRVIRNTLGAAANARLASHPHLPFFVASQQDGHLDVFNFGDLQCVTTFSLDHHNKSGPSPLLDTWLPPAFSPNGYFVSMGQRGTGEILSLQFEDIFTGCEHSAASLAKKAHAFAGTCSAVVHTAPYSAVVIAAGTDMPNPQARAGTSTKKPAAPQHFVRMVDPLVSKNTLLSCEVSHAVDYLVFDATKRLALCVSAEGMMSLYDSRKNSIVETAGLVSGGLCPAPLGSKSKSVSSSASITITAVEPVAGDDLLTIGLSNGTLLLLPQCVPHLSTTAGSPDADGIVAAAVAVMAPSHAGSRPIPITALAATPSAILCGFGDGRVCSVPIVPDRIKKQISRE